MKTKEEIRDILLFLILLLLIMDTFLHLKVKPIEAETFKIDDCITSQPSDKPAAYLHVIAH